MHLSACQYAISSAVFAVTIVVNGGKAEPWFDKLPIQVIVVKFVSYRASPNHADVESRLSDIDRLLSIHDLQNFIVLVREL